MSYDDLIALFFIGCVGCIVVSFVVVEITWATLPIVEHHATLCNHEFKASTLQHHVTPIFSTGGKMHMALTETGHSEIYTTIWDCGKYGRVHCDEEIVYRYAQEESTLYIKVWDEDIRIVGIKRNDK